MKLQEKIKLAEYTTFKIGGVAKYFAKIETKEGLREAVSFAKKKRLPIFVLGEGSDILLSDKDFDSLVIQLTNKKIDIKNGLTTCGAGVKWDDLVKVCVLNNLQGIECLSGIPGTVGASPVQNIGAYGQELKDTLRDVLAFDIEKEGFVTLSNEDCKFGYRESMFKKEKGKYIIFEISLKLMKGGTPNITYESLNRYLSEKNIKSMTLKVIRKAVIAIRNEKLENPTELPNAGSFFKNPIVDIKKFQKLREKFPDIPSYPSGAKVKLFAGWLIEQTGWKGKRLGRVGASSQNALVLINYEGETAQEIRDLSTKITEDVNSKFGIKLEPEVQLVNF